ncbi:MAG: DMT family transporter [Beijerinckiaceae bacterium]
MSRAFPALFVLIWSSGWIAAGAAVGHADPFWFLTIRFACAAAVIAAFALAVSAPWPRGRGEIGHMLASGVLLHGLYLGGVWWAVKQGVPSGLSGLLAALQPLLTAWLAPYLLGEKLSRLQWAGVLLGLGGVLLVLSPRLGFSGEALGWWPLAINVLAVVSVTAGSFYQKRFLAGGDLRVVTAVQYIGALLVVAPLALLLEERHFDHSVTVYATLAWSVIVLSVIGITLMLLMINRGEVSRVSALIYLVPATVAVQAWLVFGETLNMVQIAGLVMTALGVRLAASAR